MNKDLKIIEAIIFASSEPVEEKDLLEKIKEKNKLNQYMNEIKSHYSSRGINLNKNGTKWSFKTSAEISEELIIFKQQKRKISRAALETLAIIAYHQPITRSEIENIRGVQMGRGSIDHLLEIGWITPRGRKNIPGRPTLWCTTDNFLEQFDIETIENLPNKEELKSNGFLDKRSAIATISDLSNDDEFNNTEEQENKDEENLDDFLRGN